MTGDTKASIVARFADGASVPSLAVWHGCRHETVESVLREALVGLSRLNQMLQPTGEPGATDGAQ